MGFGSAWIPREIEIILSSCLSREMPPGLNNTVSGRLIKLSKSCIGDAEKNAVIEVLDSEFLGMGPKVQNFENLLSVFLEREVVCVSSGTAALHLALQALGVGPGDEVLVPSLTYIASFQAISATGATPVSCDVCLKTLCMDIMDIENRINLKTKVIMPVHYAGGVGLLNDVYNIAKKYKLRVVEDAAHAFGSYYQEKKIGSFGDIACFSFDGIKNITSGEGGCVVTSDKAILRRVRDLRLLGVENDTCNRFSKKRSWEFEVCLQGWRYHMSDIMAAIGIEQLKLLPEFIETRRILAKKYHDLLIDSNLKLLTNDYSQIAPHIFVVILPEYINREGVRKTMHEYGVQTGIHYKPNHTLRKYKSNKIFLKNTDFIYPFILTLPLHPDMSINDVEYICGILRNICKSP
jgi:dTDP-4-amino-4,6-dideoxygalactose transaminase